MSFSRVTSALRSPFATVLLAAIGLTACYAMARQVGTDAIADALLRVGAWLPALLALELGRAGCELLSTRAVLGGQARTVPTFVMFRAHFVSHAISTLMPLGRSVGEVSKAALLAPYVGAPRAAAVGASGQIIALFVNGALGVLGGALAVTYGCPLLMSAVLLGTGIVMIAVASLLVFGVRSPSAQRLLGRVIGTSGATEEFSDLMRSGTALGPRALLSQAASRSCQALQLGLLSYALGQPDGLSTGPLLEVVYIAGASVGDFLPAQLGVVEGVFALTASALRMSAATAVALGLTLHVTQLVGAALTAVLAAVLSRGDAFRSQDVLALSGCALALLALPSVVSAASTPSDGLPIASITSVFHIEKSQNDNQVHYAVRVDSMCRPVGREPVYGYWRDLEEGPDAVSRLKNHEGRAYGLSDQRTRPTRAQGGEVQLRLRAFPERPLLITTFKQGASCRSRAFTRLHGELAVLVSIYVKLGMLFSVDHVIVRGVRVSDGAELSERVEG